MPLKLEVWRLKVSSLPLAMVALGESDSILRLGAVWARAAAGRSGTSIAIKAPNIKRFDMRYVIFIKIR